mmetsp:Transcript_12392/g.36113  ORF Transcript_12392/g.36113 Transcript_12392/m.36113 type:complete len:555 (+) Transcript_12392:101-1765(+)
MFFKLLSSCGWTAADKVEDKTSEISFDGVRRPESASDVKRHSTYTYKRATWPPLNQLQARHPFLMNVDHSLYPWVEECEREALGGNEGKAKDVLARIEQEVEQEEQTLAAAFNLFKPKDASSLGEKEVKSMLQYLGFPDSKEDVDRLVDAVDTDGDRKVSLPEFQQYVGKMGGSYKLFELRRAQMAAKRGDKGAEVAKAGAETRMDLLDIGIKDDAQAYWRLVVPATEFEEAARMVACQRHAVRHIRILAKSNHDAAMPKLQRRVMDMGYTEQDLFMTLAYIRELAPILVHVNLSKMMKFLQDDTHYRNQFETSTSKGLLLPEKREEWERNLFGSSYDGASPFERPKYGVLDVMNDNRGVMCARDYGDSYLMLKNARLRCTFSPVDSGGIMGSRLAVLDQYAHVLMEFSDDELREVARVANAREGSKDRIGDSTKLDGFNYKEAQIHGEVDLAKHVKRLVVHPKHLVDGIDETRIRNVCSKHGWEFMWMHEERKRRIYEERQSQDGAMLEMSWANEDVVALPAEFLRPPKRTNQIIGSNSRVSGLLNAQGRHVS